MMQDIEIMVNPVFTKTLTVDTGVVRILDNHFKYKDDKLRHVSTNTEKGRRLKKLLDQKIIDDCKHFFSVKTNKLLVGFLEELKEVLRCNGYNPVVTDLRKYPKFNVPDDYDTIFGGVKFRYYQKECFDEIVRKGKKCGIIEGATAFGKTLVFLALTQMIEDRILVIFPGKQLVYQTYKEAKKHGIDDIGLVSGQSRMVGKRIMLANYQSLEILEGHENIKKFKTVMVDEMHSAKANTLYKFLKKLPATVRLGFSATPFKPKKSDALDNAFNKANLGEIIYSKKAHELIDEGFLSSLVINFLRIDHPMSKYSANHIDAVEELIVHNKYRNGIISKLSTINEKRTLIIVQRREHGEILHEMIPDSRLYVHGDTDMESRERARKELDEGTVKRVISTVVWSQGIDIPNLERILICGSGKSFYQTIQRIGRGLRKTDTKTTLEVWDFIDVTNRHLERWSQDRWRYYKSEKFPVNAVKMSEIYVKIKDNNKHN